MGNGSYRNTYDYYPWSLQTAAGGRLQKIETGTLADPDSLQGLSYSYDAVGNIESAQGMANSGQRQCYEYDHLDRLTDAYTGDSNCSYHNSWTGVGAYDRDYGFTGAEGKLGNLTSLGGLSYAYND
ncbi:MAG: hypothetical protein GY753_06035, partial [Gammaproteobacteria bacterium]|nr:hypothetical protein [Gammaproteobacteria bacterium]